MQSVQKINGLISFLNRRNLSSLRSLSISAPLRTKYPLSLYGPFGNRKYCFNDRFSHALSFINPSVCLANFSDSSQSAAAEGLGRGDKIIRAKLSKMRLDAALKAGLGLSRSKVEKLLYEDKLRLNGERPLKKSQAVKKNDEIDVVRGINIMNPKFLDVSRVEILDAEESNDSGSDSDSDDESYIQVVLKRCKVLTIQNYDDPWK